MRSAALLLLPLAAARPPLTSESYASWLSEFQSRFPGTEETFHANLATIRAHNANPASTWKMGVNHFTALTRAEFKKYYSGYKPDPAARLTRKFADVSSANPAAWPTSVDWRKQGVVTPVKDQAMCGGCWAFSATETLESAIAIKTGKLMVLSEQQILDCTPNPDECGGTGGCNGATQELAFAYVSGQAGTATSGITTNQNYPWTGGSDFPNCHANKIKPVANITGYVTLPFNNYTAIMDAVVNVGPIAISAAAEAWQFYDSGVFSSSCGTDVDHAIVLEGYGHDSASNLDYYLVRNSWGTGWGEQGYIRVARYGSTAKGEPCGTDNTPGDGDGCQGGPSSIQVCGLCGILSDSSYPVGASLL